MAADVLLAAKSQLTIDASIIGIVALIAGLVILFVPRILNYVVAAYLIFIGLVDIFDLKL